MRPWLLILLLVFLIKSADSAAEKRSSMGGSAFGSLDRIPISYLRKYYRQKTTKRDDYIDSPREKPYEGISLWPLY